MRSGLEVPVLGSIWMEVDQDRRGKVFAVRGSSHSRLIATSWR